MFLLMTWMTGWSTFSASSRAEGNCSGAGVFDILEGSVPLERPKGWRSEQAEKEHYEIQQKQM